jgi:hypothetical protein
MRKILILACIALFSLTCTVCAQTSPDNEVRRILSKGINFDHIFFPYEGNHPLSPEQWGKIRENLKGSEFEQVADLGFTHVRMNLGRGFIQDPKAPYPLLPDGLVLLDQAVSMAQKNGLGIVLDMHQIPPPDLFHDPKAM